MEENNNNNNNNKVMEVVIVGGGIAGFATAIALHKIGLSSSDFLVLEKASELRTSSGAALGLWPNAWRALRELGVDDKLSNLYKPLDSGRVTELKTGKTTIIPFNQEQSSDGLQTRAVHRKVLLEVLAEAIPPNVIRFNSKLSSIDKSPTSSIIALHMDDGATIKTKVLIGCDGYNSVVAKWLGLHPPVHSGRSAFRGFSYFPNGHGFKQELRQFLYQGSRSGFGPLNDKEIFWFATNHSEPKDSEIAKDPKLIQEYCLQKMVNNTLPSEYVDVIRRADIKSVSLAPLMFRWPWELFSGHVSMGNVTVAGDAMHPMTPDLGQGGCIALEDAVVLVRNLGEALNKNNKVVAFDNMKAIEEALARYVKERRGRAAALIMGSYISGWVQCHTGWLVTYLRDKVFFRFILKRMMDVMKYDCGKLPSLQNLE